jgi:hypothetical protein
MIGQRREGAMKQIALVFHAAMAGLFLFALCAYAGALDDEAKKAIFDYYKRRHALTLCGDSAYISTLSTGKLRIWQGKKFSIKLRPEETSYADHLNGIEWKGSGEITAKANRVFLQDTGWTPWSPDQDNIKLDVVLTKKQGKWSVKMSGSFSEPAINQPMGCKQIESMTK